VTSQGGDLRRTSVRLGLQTGLLVVGVLAVVGVLIFVIYARAADEAADATLREATSNIDSPREAPPGVHVVVVTPRGQRESASMPAGFPDQAALTAVRRDGRIRETDRTIDGRDYTVRTERVGTRVTQAVLDRHELEEERGRILTSLLIAGGVGVLLAALVATWLARRAMQPLTESLAMQRRFVADASHELRTPLTLLSTRLQLVARRARHQGGELGADALAGVLADTGRLTDILDDLLLAADTRAAERTRLDLAAVARESVDAAAGTAGDRGLVLVLLAPAEVWVAGAATALRRAVTALVDNALDHAATRVEVEVAARSGTAAVTVTDDGPGIAESVRPRLFERFTGDRDAGAPSSRRHYGMGLALVAEVAASQDGSVSAANRPDGSSGAVLKLTLPVLPGSAFGG